MSDPEGPLSSAGWAPLPAAWAESAPVALAVLAADGLVLHANAAFEAFTGFAAGADLALLLGAAVLPPPGVLARLALRHADGTMLACDAQRDDAGTGRALLTLVDRCAQAEARHAADLLDF